MPNSTTLERDRDTLYQALVGARNEVVLRTEFNPLDNSVLYASNGSRDFLVLVIEDVSWGPELSSYIEGPDEFRSCSTMVVDVPNSLEGQLEAVRSLFQSWFSGG